MTPTSTMIWREIDRLARGRFSALDITRNGIEQGITHLGHACFVYCTPFSHVHYSTRLAKRDGGVEKGVVVLIMNDDNDTGMKARRQKRSGGSKSSGADSDEIEMVLSTRNIFRSHGACNWC